MAADTPQTQEPQETRSGPAQRLAPGAGIGFAVCGLLIKLMAVFTARVDWDTNYYLNIGSNYIERGGLTPYMWRLDPSWNIVGGGGTGYGIMTLIWWFKAFGLSVDSGQVFMYLIGLATLPLVYWYTASWYGKHAGFWAAIFAALCGPFLVANYIRMDAPGTLMDAAALCLYCYAIRGQRMIWHAVTGVLVIVAAEFHTLAILYAVGLCCIYGYEHIREAIRARRVWIMTPAVWFGAGLAVASAVYVVVHIVPNPDIYFLIPRTCSICAPPGLAKEISRYSLFAERYPVELGILIASVGVALWRWRIEANRRYVLLVAGMVIAIAVFNAPDGRRYTGHFFPAIALGAGALIATADGAKWGAVRRFAPIAALGVSGVLLVMHAARYHDYYPPRDLGFGFDGYAEAVEYVREHIPNDAVVMGPVTLYNGLLDYPNYLAFQDGTEYAVAIRGETNLDFWEREKPLVFIGQPPGGRMIREYMERHHFEHVRPNLWISAEQPQN